MQSELKSPARRRAPRSLFFPLLLIALGVVLLLDNLGLLGGSVGTTLLKLWPFLLILLGVDGFLERSGVAGPSFLIGLGFVLLLSNFGYLRVDIWQALFTLWPILLIAWGFDWIFGRRSWLTSLIGMAVTLAVLIAAVIFLNGGLNPAARQATAHNLGDAQALEMILDIPVGSLRLRPASQIEAQISGFIPRSSTFKVIEEFALQEERAVYHLGVQGKAFGIPALGGNWLWEFTLPPQQGVTLQIQQGAGNADLDLDGLMLRALDAEFGVGQWKVVLPAGKETRAKISGAVGQILIIVPQQAAVRLRCERGLAYLRLPENYLRVDEVYTSPSYASSAQKIELDLSMAVGAIIVQTR